VGAAPLVGATTSLALATLPVRELLPGNEEDDGEEGTAVEATPVAARQELEGSLGRWVFNPGQRGRRWS
jgi:hypothetical protein